MSILGSYRLFNRLDNGSLTGAQLDTLLAGSRELAEFKQLCDTPQAASALAASPTAVAAIAGSAIARQAVLDNRRNFDVVARQRLSAGSVTFLEQFLYTETVPTGLNGSGFNPKTIFYNNGNFWLPNTSATTVVITDGFGKNILSSLVTDSVGMAVGNGVYVSVAPGSSFSYSTDGFSWFNTSVLNQSWRDVAFGNGVFVAISLNPGLLTSTDGITWTSRTAPSGSWNSIVFANGQFVAVGTNVVATSTDGITWTLRTIPTADWTSVTHGNGLYVAVANTSGVGSIATSPDGVTWTSRTIPPGSGSMSSVAFGGGLFVAITAGSTNYVVSKDGLVWYRKTSVAAFNGATGVPRGIAYGNGMFLMNSNSATPAQVQRSISSVLP
jgi:hypothetical protein